jgi:transcriptional regulator with XRE-family HTH domain
MASHSPAQTRYLIGGALRRLREDGGLTLEQLAQRVGTSHEYLSGIENGEENFSIQSFEQICAALNSTPAQVVMAAYSDR